MAATAPIEDLKELESELLEFQNDHPEAFEDIRHLIANNRKIGYRNICRLILGDTPKKLKGEE